MGDDKAGETVNPYAAPSTSTAMVLPAREVSPLPPPKLPAVLVKWSVVCTLAAAPSFFLASGLANGRLAANLGMIVGVLMFVIAYAAIELSETVQNQLAKPVAHRSVWIAYATRVGVSVLFPIGLIIDMFCGMIAISVSSMLVGLPGPSPRLLAGDVDSMVLFFQFWFTTVFQGFLLNVVLIAYMGIVWVICKAMSSQ